MSTQTRRRNNKKTKKPGTTEAPSSSCGSQQPKAAEDVANLPRAPSIYPPQPTAKSTASQSASPSAPAYAPSVVSQQHLFIDMAIYETTRTQLDRLAADHERLKAAYDLLLSETNSELKATIVKLEATILKLEADLSKSLEENNDLRRRNEALVKRNEDLEKEVSQVRERITVLEEQIRTSLDKNARLEEVLAKSKREFRIAFVGSIGFNFVRRVFIHIFPDKDLPGGVSLESIERSCRSAEQMEALDTLIPSTHRATFKRILRDVSQMRLGMAHPTNMFRENESDPVVYPTVEDLRAEAKIYYGADVRNRSFMDDIITTLAKLVMEQDKNLDNLLTNSL